MTGRHRAGAGAAGIGSVRKSRLIHCRDVAGRRRAITVFAEGGRVVMVVPPGETAVLALAEVGQLRAALHDVLVEVISQDGGRS